jgi:hypothetical protein
MLYITIILQQCDVIARNNPDMVTTDVSVIKRQTILKKMFTYYTPPQQS